MQGYRGVIVGWDRTCCEDDEWRERAQVNRLSRRDNQPFYHVLVDQVSKRGVPGQTPGLVPYVLSMSPRDRSMSVASGWTRNIDGGKLSWPRQVMFAGPSPQNHSRWESSDGRAPVAYVAEEMIKVPKGQSWAEAYGDGEVAHPYYYLLFFGKDSQGGCIPIAQLREQYGQDRRDVYADDDGYDSDDDWDDGDEPKSPEKDPDGP